ncbi:hypothetical protein M2341_000569 [Sphingobium sp. B7D2B]|uniref:hypothetical protein n=1 Tax=Sphingobium sp. B7D2B TaxID=2940583 RepID=UPI00222414F1|nr:hypothetical protein [Sphingobium sp. B7D2B]MCW2365122.1 hypothetical protein [Sphingobium sp. B7D2B]
MSAPLIAMLALAGAQMAPPPLVANDDQAHAARLHIGDTGVRCVRQPCPSRALFDPKGQAGQTDRQAMLYVDLDGSKPSPPMIGDPTALAAIRTAWNERQCLAIEGRLIPGEDDRPVLRVDRVVGPCHQ